MKRLVNGKKEGLWEEYHSNGKLECRRNYKEDRLHGLYEEYNSNGGLFYRCYYKDGKSVGLCQYFYKNGNIERQFFRKDGVLTERNYFDNTGILNRNKNE
jgi:antitoxin component YwqK of YwqJK toxin-antitoxin module